MKKRVFSMVSLFLVMAILTSCGVSTGNVSPTEEKTNAAAGAPEAALVASKEVDTPPTEQAGPTSADQPQILKNALERARLEFQDLHSSQVIVVVSQGAYAEIFAFAKDDRGLWTEALQPMEGYVGYHGVTAHKQEGDKMTPAGLYTLTQAFGICQDPGSGLPYRQVTGNSCWVDDPDSVYYNQWVEDTGTGDWDSAERLMHYSPQYDYAVVIDYNCGPVVPGAGSAIFLHCGSDTTAGCVAVDKDRMREILVWLDSDCSPKILIV